MKASVIFMGTPDFSVPILQGLIENYEVKAVITRKDKPVGRKGEVLFSPVKKEALKHNIPCLQPEKIKDITEDIKKMNPDMIVTCAYGQIIPIEILNIPVYGCINVHASLLPKLRGGAPIHHAIIDGYDKTGITIMYMDTGMDSGDIIAQRDVPITKEDTMSTLHDKLQIIGKDLLLETIPSILNKTNKRIKQNENEVTFGYNIKREDEKINFDNDKVKIFNQIRGLNSSPGAYCLYEGQILKVWSSYYLDNNYDKENGTICKIYKDGFGVKVKDGEIVFTEVQISGKQKVRACDFINGHDLLGKVLK